MCDQNRMKASIISGVMEVGVTHPLDYIKTILHSRTGKTVDNSFKTGRLLIISPKWP